MNIGETTIKKFTITDAARLDPVGIFVEDIEPGKGSITVTCYGRAWTAYWGSMGDRTVQQFMASCGVDYLLGCFGTRLELSVKNQRAEDGYLRRILETVKEAMAATSAWMDAPKERAK